VRAEPDVVSPNVVEAEELVGHEFNEDADRIFAVREIVSLGARSVIMTMREGCWAQLLVDGAPRLYHATVPPVEAAVATIGSGDAFLAGYIAAHYRGQRPEELRRRLRRGVDRPARRRPDRRARGRAAARRRRCERGRRARPRALSAMLGGRGCRRPNRVSCTAVPSAPRPRIVQWK